MKRKLRRRYDNGGNIQLNLNPLKGVSIPIDVPELDVRGINPIDIKANTGSSGKGLGDLSGIISLAGNTLGSLINYNGYNSKAGSAITGGSNLLGTAIGTFNPAAGAIISGSGALLGGITNTLFGSRLNEAGIASAKSGTTALNRTEVDSSDTNSLLNQYNSQDWGSDFSLDDIGSDGIFSSKASDEYNSLKRDRDLAIMNLKQRYNTGALNISKNQSDNVMKTLYAEGGSIHISPSKKGTFTAAAKKHGKSVQAFASQVLANKDNYSPAMVKKANFARNFGRRKRAYGGYLEGWEYDLDEATIRDLLDRGYEIEYI